LSPWQCSCKLPLQFVSHIRNKGKKENSVGRIPSEEHFISHSKEMTTECLTSAVAVFLIGHGGSGKTILGHRIRDNGLVWPSQYSEPTHAAERSMFVRLSRLALARFGCLQHHF
jgi:hypothetical protein